MNEIEEVARKICIAISGTHGAGTSTTAKNIANIMGLRYISAGELFRQSAEERGIDISEFTKIVEGDFFLKEELDSKIQEEAKSGNVVVEGRVACWTASEYADLRVMIDAPFQIRVERISRRSGMSIERAETETRQRDNQERLWFRENMDIDIDDRSVYDITINTERLSPDKVSKIISTIFSETSQPD